MQLTVENRTNQSKERATEMENSQSEHLSQNLTCMERLGVTQFYLNLSAAK